MKLALVVYASSTLPWWPLLLRQGHGAVRPCVAVRGTVRLAGRAPCSDDDGGAACMHAPWICIRRQATATRARRRISSNSNVVQVLVD
jgi:hypothetical protein